MPASISRSLSLKPLAALLLGVVLVGAATAQEAPPAEPAADVAEAVVDEATEAAEATEAEVAEQTPTTEEPAPEAEPAPTTEAPSEPVEEPAADPEPAAIDEAEATDTAEAPAEAEEPAELVPDEASEIVSDATEAAEEALDDAADAASEMAEDAEQAVEETVTDWAGLVERAPPFFALTHHAAVHLPIALWLFGALFVVIGVFAPSVRMQIPLACLVGGALTSVAAVFSGWWYAEFEWGADWKEIDWSELIVQHRWAGVALAAVSLVLSLIALVNLSARSAFWGFVWRVGLIALALAVAWEGHIGGEMIHGEGFIEEAYEAWVNPEAE